MPDKDLKDALDATLKLQKDTQDSYAKAEVEVKKLGHVAAETKEKVEKLELAVDTNLENAQKRWDELERRSNRAELFGGASDKAEALALEVKAFNGRLARMHGARRAAPARSLALPEPLPASPWSALRVSAAAMPVGNLSCSTLIICCFMGMAMTTPSMAMLEIQKNMGQPAMGSPVIIISAGMAATVPPHVM